MTSVFEISVHKELAGLNLFFSSLLSIHKKLGTFLLIVQSKV